MMILASPDASLLFRLVVDLKIYRLRFDPLLTRVWFALGLLSENLFHNAPVLVLFSIGSVTSHATPLAQLSKSPRSRWCLAIDQSAVLAEQHDTILGGRFVLAKQDVEYAIVPVRFLVELLLLLLLLLDLEVWRGWGWVRKRIGCEFLSGLGVLGSLLLLRMLLLGKRRVLR